VPEKVGLFLIRVLPPALHRLRASAAIAHEKGAPGLIEDMVAEGDSATCRHTVTIYNDIADPGMNGNGGARPSRCRRRWLWNVSTRARSSCMMT
jgi:hypothetical protein